MEFMTIPGLSLPPLPDAERVSLAGAVGELGGYIWRQPGQAPAALLLHGWGQDALAMAGPARLLHGAGWQVLSMSQRGWRGSAGCDDYGHSGPADVGRMLAWFAAQPGVQAPPVLLGFSMGGLSALLTASRPGRPAGSVSHVVAVSAPTDLQAVHERTTLRLLRRCYDAVLTAAQWREGSPVTHVSGLQVPALLVVGTQDRICMPEVGRQYAAAAGAPLLEYADMGHSPNDAQWHAIIREVMAWTQEPASGRSRLAPDPSTG